MHRYKCQLVSQNAVIYLSGSLHSVLVFEKESYGIESFDGVQS